MMRIMLMKLVIFLISIKSSAFNADSTGVELAMKMRKISDSKDLSVILKIKSYEKGYLFLPKEEEWGYLRQHSGFFSIQVQRKSAQNYIDIPEGAHIDIYPIEAVDTLRQDDARKYKFSMRGLYHYYKGEYRVRVLVNFSNRNKVKNKYSKWVYFVCEKRLYD